MASSKLNSNDAGAQTRLEFVKHTFNKTFNLQVRETKPIAYDEGFPFPYNNFVYAVSVDRSGSSKTPSVSVPKQPGTQAIPSNETTFIFRLPNPLSGYNDTVRIENEVAALSLAREALQPCSLSDLIPRVYDWNSAASGKGWILQQYMSGEGLLDRFPSFSVEEKKNILSQMADILGCFQRFRLPSTIGKYGGVGFDGSGRYISTALSIFKAGPFDTYEELLRATITSKLAQADIDPRVKGWRENGIRKRLDQFLTEGLSTLLRDMPLDKALIHADFSIDNVLYDSLSKKVTALFDFDFGHISSVADEFFRSLGHDIGRFPSTRDQGTAELHNAMLHGFPDPLPLNSGEVDWVAAKAWDDALKERELQRPATIPHIDTLADIFWLSSQILPFKLCNKVVVGNSTDEQLKRRKEDGEALLDSFLADFGY